MILGATIRLKDSFTGTLKQIRKDTNEFKKGMDTTNQSITKTTAKLKVLGKTVARPIISIKNTSGAVLNRVKADLLSLKGLATITLGGIGISKLGNATLGGAMGLETDRLTLQALMGDVKKANKLFDAMNRKGQLSSFSEKEFLTGAQSFLPLTKNLKQLDKLANIQERMAMSNRIEGMEGAAFSIREALSGDTVSLAERFNIPKSMLKDAFNGATNLEQRIKALDKILNQMGFTQKFVTDVNKSASAQWDNLKSNISMAFAKMGGKGLERLKISLEKINGFFSNQKFMGKLINGGGNLIAQGLDAILVKAKKTFEHIKTNYIENPSFRSLTFTGKVNFILDDFTQVFTKWLENGGGQKISDFGGKVGVFIGEGLISVAPTIGTNFADALVSAFVAGLNSSPAGAVIAGALGGAAIGSIVPGLGTGIGAGIGAGAGLITHYTYKPINNRQGGNVKTITPTKNKNYVGLPTGTGLPVYKKKALGLPYVPYDNYPALLHRGEQVLTRAEADNRKNGNPGVVITGNNFYVREDADIDRIANAVVYKIIQADLNYGGAG